MSEEIRKTGVRWGDTIVDTETRVQFLLPPQAGVLVHCPPPLPNVQIEQMKFQVSLD